MSTLRERATTKDEIREQVAQLFDFHESSRQAVDGSAPNRHNDGQRIYQELGIAPFHKYLNLCERKSKNVATYPSAFVTPFVHLKEREIELIESIEGEVEYDSTDWYPTHEALERFPPLRAKTLEWIAADDGDRTAWKSPGNTTIDVWTEGGSDMQVYGEPGCGKSTFMNFATLSLQQVNNETVILADTMDDSGTNERTEWLALAPYADIAVPEGIPVEVRVVPEDPSVSTLTYDLEDICRDVVRYSSPLDLCRQLEPGQFYVTFPDPLHRGCEDVSQFAFHPPGRVTPVGESGPNRATPADQWWFAFWAARISQDVFTHWTTLQIDEAGNVFDPDASKDEHETYQKIKWFAEKAADARKKGVSVFTYTHALTELQKFWRRKQRWWVTMNGMEPPVGKSLPGDKSCPVDDASYTRNMSKGEATAWNTTNYASISWPNVKRGVRLDAEISIDFDLEAVGA